MMWLGRQEEPIGEKGSSWSEMNLVSLVSFPVFFLKKHLVGKDFQRLILFIS